MPVEGEPSKPKKHVSFSYASSDHDLDNNDNGPRAEIDSSDERPSAGRGGPRAALTSMGPTSSVDRSSARTNNQEKSDRDPRKQKNKHSRTKDVLHGNWKDQRPPWPPGVQGSTGLSKGDHDNTHSMSARKLVDTNDLTANLAAKHEYLSAKEAYLSAWENWIAVNNSYTIAGKDLTNNHNGKQGKTAKVSFQKPALKENEKQKTEGEEMEKPTTRQRHGFRSMQDLDTTRQHDITIRRFPYSETGIGHNDGIEWNYVESDHNGANPQDDGEDRTVEQTAFNREPERKKSSAAFQARVSEPEDEEDLDHTSYGTGSLAHDQTQVKQQTAPVNVAEEAFSIGGNSDALNFESEHTDERDWIIKPRKEINRGDDLIEDASETHLGERLASEEDAALVDNVVEPSSDIQRGIDDDSVSVIRERKSEDDSRALIIWKPQHTSIDLAQPIRDIAAEEGEEDKFSEYTVPQSRSGYNWILVDASDGETSSSYLQRSSLSSNSDSSSLYYHNRKNDWGGRTRRPRPEPRRRRHSVLTSNSEDTDQGNNLLTSSSESLEHPWRNPHKISKRDRRRPPASSSSTSSHSPPTPIRKPIKRSHHFDKNTRGDRDPPIYLPNGAFSYPYPPLNWSYPFEPYSSSSSKRPRPQSLDPTSIPLPSYSQYSLPTPNPYQSSQPLNRQSSPPSYPLPYLGRYNQPQNTQEDTSVGSVDRYGERIIIELPYNGPQIDQIKDDELPGPTHFDEHSATCVKVLASTRFADHLGNTKVDLTGEKSDHYRPSPSISRNSHFLWVHMQSRSQDGFEEYKRLIHAIGRQYRRYLPLITSLLEKVDAQAIETKRKGQYGEPFQTVLKVDGHNSEDQDHPHISATLLEFPTISTASLQDCKESGVTPLFQALYNRRGDAGPDSRQSVFKRPGNELREVLVVPSIWAMCLDSEVMITYSQNNLPELYGSNIQLSTRTDGFGIPTIVKLEDLTRRIHFFDTSSCQTFYELHSLIFKERLHNIPFDAMDQIDIVFEDGRRVTAETWLIALQRWPSLVITLNLVLRVRSVSNDLSGDSEDDWSLIRHQNSQSMVASDTTLNSRPQEAPQPCTGLTVVQRLGIERRSDTINSGNQRDEPKMVCEPLPPLLLESATVGSLGTESSQFLTWTGAQRNTGLIHVLSQLQKSFELSDSPLLRKGDAITLPELRQSLKKSSESEGLTGNGSRPANQGATSPHSPNPDSGDTSAHTNRPATPNIKSVVDVRQRSLRNRIYQCAATWFLLFLPDNVDHYLTQKYWGALQAISNSFIDGNDTSFMGIPPDLWVVLDPKHYLDKNELKSVHEPSVDVNSCQICFKATKYYTKDKALEHLTKHHFPNVSPNQHESLYPWIPSMQMAKLGLWKKLQNDILERALATLSAACKKAQNISDGVQEDQKSSKIGLSPSIIDSFKNSLRVLLLMARTSRLVSTKAKNWTFEPGPLAAKIDIMTPSIEKAKERLTIAESDLMTNIETFDLDMRRMINMRLPARSISYTAIGPEFLLLVILRNLTDQAILGSPDISSLYEDISNELQNEISHKPQKRLVQKINRLSQEIELLSKLSFSQAFVFERLHYILWHSAFESRPVNPRRGAMFSIESPTIYKNVESCNMRTDKFTELLGRMRDCKKQLQQDIEVLEADNNKAIFVFTTVTIIFLPLSFVTSFLGMNTTDIRNSENSQWIFWTIGLPLTVVVIGAALMVAYKGDQLHEWSKMTTMNLHEAKERIRRVEYEIRQQIIEFSGDKLPLTWRKRRRPRRADTGDSGLV